MGVRAESTPNPNAIKFTTDAIIFEGSESISVIPGETSEFDILNDLMRVNGVDNVFGYQHFITVNKQPDVEWSALQNDILAVFERYGL